MRFTNQFCGVCGGRLPRQPQDTDTVVIPAGSLDDETPVRPQARIFTGSRASWSCSGDASADFEGRGLAATNIRYRARVTSASSAAEIAALLRETDAVAEVHNTLRTGPAVTLEQ